MYIVYIALAFHNMSLFISFIYLAQNVPAGDQYLRTIRTVHMCLKKEANASGPLYMVNFGAYLLQIHTLPCIINKTPTIC